MKDPLPSLRDPVESSDNTPGSSDKAASDSATLQLLAQAFDSLPELMFITGDRGTVLYANALARSVCSHPGCDAETVSPKTQVLRPEWKSLERALRDSGSVRRHRLRTPDPAGGTITLEVSAVRLPPTGSSAIAAMIRDVSEQERTLALLSESQEVANVGGWELALDSGVFKATPKLFGMLDLPPDATLTVVHALKLFRHEYRRLVRRATLDAIRYGIPFDVEADIRNDFAGEFNRVRLRGRAEKHDGNVVAVFGTLQDVTDMYRSEQERRRNEHRLRQVSAELSFAEERERKRLAANLHDEIVQDLGTLKLMLTQLTQTTPPGIQRSNLSDAVNLLNRTIGQTRALMYEISPPLLYDLGVVSALEWLVENLGESTGIQCTFQADARTEKLQVPDDIAILVFQTVRELLANVRQHSRASTVSVRCTFDDGALTIAVADNGIGFDQARQQRPERRADHFGLFMVRNRIDYFGGSVAIDSVAGAGTRIVINLPVVQHLAASRIDG